MRARDSTDEVAKRHQRLKEIATSLQELFDAMQPCRLARRVACKDAVVCADANFDAGAGVHGADAAATAGLKAEEGAALCDSTLRPLLPQ